MKTIFLIVGVLAFCCSQVCAQQKDQYKAMVDSAVTIKYTRFQETIKNHQNKDYLETLYLINEQDEPLNFLPSSSKFKIISVYDDRNRKVVSKGMHGKSLPC